MDEDEQNHELTEALRKLGEGIQRIDGTQQRQGGELSVLRGTVSGLRGELGGLEGRLTSVTGDVGALRDDVSRIDGRLTEQQKWLAQFKEEWRRNEIKRDAQQEHARLLAERDRRFSQRDRTRELAHGLVHTATAENVRRGMLDADRIRACAEERLLHEPAYWLAPALFSVAVDHIQKGELSVQAIGHATTLDDSKTYLFRALIAARFENAGRAGGWMDNYLQTLDPQRLTQDFLVVLEAIAGNELGVRAHTYAVKTMDRWYSEAPVSADHATRSRERAKRWQQRMWSLRSRLPESEFGELRKIYAGDWGQLVELFEQATVAHGTLAYLIEEFPAAPQPPARGKHVHSALEHLIDRLEPDEAELHAKIEWQQRIIDASGDLAAAAREHELRQSVDAEVMDFEELLDNAVFRPSQVELGLAARRLALLCVWRQIQTLSEAFVRASLQRWPKTLPISIDGWRASLPADPAAAPDEPGLQAALADHMTGVTSYQVAAVQPRWPRVFGGAAGVLAGLTGAILLSVVLVTLVVAGALVCLYEYRWVPAERRRLQVSGALRKEETASLLAQALEQRKELLNRWSSYAGRLAALKGWLPPGERTPQ